MEPEPLKIAVNERDSVSALLYRAAKSKRAGFTVVLGHGAGANQLSGFMRLFARGLAERGLDTITFNFLYSEQGRSGPDPKAKLESCFEAVIEAAIKHKQLRGNRLVLGGKSMGGRIGSQVAASRAQQKESPDSAKEKGEKQKAATSDEIAGLVFLGYPLHPPGKPDQLRDKHLPDIKAPMLFIQGTRDPFGTPEELREVIKRLRLRATLHLIEGGDHSFKVPKSIGISQDELYESVMDEIANWLGSK